MTLIPGGRDAIVVGSGPNGMAAAIRLAQAGHSVTVVEAQDTVGGAARSMELTLPGFVNDFGSAILPLGAASPFLRGLPLESHGVEWIHPEAPLAHPLDDGSAALLYRSVDTTAEGLGEDAGSYRKIMGPFARNWEDLTDDLLAPLRPPGHPLLMARFGLYGLRSASSLAGRFRGPHARALIGGLAAHSFLPLTRRPSAAFALMLGMLGHGVGWPFPRGGTQCFTDALVSYFRSLDGEIAAGSPVRSLEDLPEARATIYDVTPRQLLSIAGPKLSGMYRRQLERYRYGPAVFKLDYALSGPIPWTADECRLAGTVHLGGTFEEVAASEAAVWRGEAPEKPFVLLAQQSLFDATRAPEGKQTAWAYCHVPNGCTEDMTERIEAQIERFAPGFRDLVMDRHVLSPAGLECRDANLVGGDINGGVQDLWQQYTRPAIKPVPYTTPIRNLYLCSSSTPPGGGVHGMCGYFAAEAALKRSF
jgi:phytoene dehydrogenase-like protein